MRAPLLRLETCVYTREPKEAFKVWKRWESPCKSIVGKISSQVCQPTLEVVHGFQTIWVHHVWLDVGVSCRKKPRLGVLHLWKLQLQGKKVNKCMQKWLVLPKPQGPISFFFTHIFATFVLVQIYFNLQARVNVSSYVQCLCSNLQTCAIFDNFYILLFIIFSHFDLILVSKCHLNVPMEVWYI